MRRGEGGEKRKKKRMRETRDERRRKKKRKKKKIWSPSTGALARSSTSTITTKE